MLIHEQVHAAMEAEDILVLDMLGYELTIRKKDG